ncbi:MAG: hypothetical protein QNK44_07910 [Hyphomicrobiaceae bacterium]|nr:hypothetical protein [Hyphomicrobiaceae bacterium]
MSDHEQECENPGEMPTISSLQIENFFLIERAGKAEAALKVAGDNWSELRIVLGAAEARCKRLEDALHAVKEDAWNEAEAWMESARQASVERRRDDDRRFMRISNAFNRLHGFSAVALSDTAQNTNGEKND